MGAKAHLSNDLTKQVREFETDATGSFTFAKVPPGSYTLKVAQPTSPPWTSAAPKLVLLPAEPFVPSQLWAQEVRPAPFIMSLGSGECAPGYIPTAREIEGGCDDDCSWIAAPECERAMREALRDALNVT